MDVSRLVNLVYVCTALLSFVVLNKALKWLWASVDALKDVPIGGSTITLTTVLALAGAAALVTWMWRKRETYAHLSEVVLELQKVTWPSMDETKRSTLIVVAFTVVFSIFLAGSDQVWKFITDYLLTPGT